MSPKRSSTNVALDYPELYKQWDHEKNSELGFDPEKIIRVDDQFWWQCDEHESHNWPASLRSRAGKKKRGCPFCANKAVCVTNSLATVFPEIAAEWHPTDNKPKTPNDYVHGSAQAVWWMCSKNPQHVWRDKIFHRTRNGKSCPDCREEERRSKSLGALFPILGAEFDEKKNHCSVFSVAPFSHKDYWWRCGSCNHSWKLNVAQRHNSGCPECSTRKVGLENNLLVVNPALAALWHPTKNGDLKPSDVLASSKIPRWWLCSEVREHEWEKSPKTQRDRGCPHCHQIKNSLKTRFPDIAAEWHPTKNQHLGVTPETISYGSKKRVWWQCGRFPEHEWPQSPNGRTAGDTRGCPHCTHHTSAPELRVLTEMKAVFDSTAARERIKGKEIDIYIPELAVGIEYDGSYFHKNRESKDSAKTEFFRAHGISIIRLREEPLKQITALDIVVPQGGLTKSSIDRLFDVISSLKSTSGRVAEEYKGHEGFINEAEYRRYLSYLPAPLPEESLAALDPSLAAEWDMERNKPLTPDLFTPFSQKEVHWQCLKHSDHRWPEKIAVRSSNRGCPFCSLHRVSDLNRLTVTNPEIAREWHPVRNGDNKPEDFSQGSRELIWWQCPKKHYHAYQMPIQQRTRGYNCSFCAGKNTHELDSIAHLFPEIAAEWDYAANKPLRKRDPSSPKEVSPGSSRKVWWICSKCGNKYKKQVHQRTKFGRGCRCSKS